MRLLSSMLASKLQRANSASLWRSTLVCVCSVFNVRPRDVLCLLESILSLSRRVSSRFARFRFAHCLLQGLCIAELALGIESFLDTLKQALSQLDASVAAFAPYSVLHVHAQLFHFLEQFSWLTSLCDFISNVARDGKAQGTLEVRLRDRLFDDTRCGKAQLEQLASSLLERVQRVFFTQLEAWLLRGELVDPFGELFVRAANDGFALSNTLVPRLIGEQLAERIFFTGRAVRSLLRADEQAAREITRKAIEPSKQIEIEAALNSSRVALQQLASNHPLSSLHIEQLVSAIMQRVSAQLWQLAQQHMQTHLSALHEFYLLRRGEFYGALIEGSAEMMRHAPNAGSEAAINMLAHQCAVRTQASDSFTRVRFRLTLERPVMSAATWTLRPSCELPWPFDTLLVRASHERYSALWNFLFAAQRAAIALQRVWALARDDAELQRCWHLRVEMNFFVETLHNYLHVSVLPQLIAELERELQQVGDFQHAHAAHETFLSSLHSRCFLNSHAIAASFHQLFQLSIDLAQLHASAVLAEHIERLEADFKRHSEFVFNLLSLAKTKHASQLCMMLDFNLYLSNNAKKM
jgi:hypothetical protein